MLGDKNPFVCLKNASLSLRCRSVVDTVYAIRDQVMRLGSQSKEMLRMLEEEVAARKKLEAVVKAQQQVLQQQQDARNHHDSRGSLGK